MAYEAAIRSDSPDFTRSLREEALIRAVTHLIAWVRGTRLVAERQIVLILLDGVQPEDGVQPVEQGAQIGEVHLVGWSATDVGEQLAEPPDLMGDLGVRTAHRGGGTTAECVVKRGVEDLLFGGFVRGDLLGEHTVGVAGFGQGLGGREEVEAVRPLHLGSGRAGDWRKKTITQRSYLARFGGEVHRSRFGASGRVAGGLLFSREYTLADRVNVFRGILGSMKLLWPELLEVDLFERVPEINVPVFFIEGRYDHECPSEIAERYFSALRAPAKQLIWFDRSAHLPNAEERDLFNRIMVEKVLPIATAAVSGSSDGVT